MTSEIAPVPRVAVEAADVIVSGAATAATQIAGSSSRTVRNKNGFRSALPGNGHRYREEAGGDELEETI